MAQDALSAKMRDRTALITGGSSGFGAGAARLLAQAGARVVIADVDADAGRKVAEEIDGSFVACDVSDLAQNEAAVAAAVQTFGGLDLAFLNAGVSGGFGLGADFDPVGYRKAMGVNLDGVVFGVHAALPALRERGGGDIVATASLAGLTPMPGDPVYTANKTAVVGLVRSLGPCYTEENIRINALCPSFARTAIIDPIEDSLNDSGVPILEVSDVVAAFRSIVTGGSSGEAWFVQVGRESAPFTFRGVPGPRHPVSQKES